jgi:hypothetical protein
MEYFLNLFFGYCNEPFDLPITTKKKKRHNLFKLLEAFQKEASIGRSNDFPLAKLYR